MTKQEPKYIHRLPPTPAYDIAGTEQWLEEMAEKGYHISPYDGFTFGIAAFEVGTPKKIKYRLEPILHGGSIMSGDEKPSEEALALYEEYGWEYVAQWKHFFVYRSDRSDARELHTDPEIQAMALKGVQKDLRGALFSSLFLIALNIVLRISMGQSYPPLFVTMVNMGTLLTVGWILWFCWMFWDIIRNIRMIRGLRKWIRSGGSMRSAPMKHEKHYMLKRMLLLGTTIVLFVAAFGKFVKMEDYGIPLEEYTKEVPFATIADLYPEGEYGLEQYGFGNYVQEWSDLIAPENYRWDEIASVTLPDGSSLEGSYDVYYHRTISPVIARILAEEYYLQDRYHKDFEEKECPSLDVDFAVLYIGKYHYPTLILQKGNVVIRAEFWITETPADGYSISDWAIAMADSIS